MNDKCYFQEWLNKYIAAGVFKGVFANYCNDFSETQINIILMEVLIK